MKIFKLSAVLLIICAIVAGILGGVILIFIGLEIFITSWF